MARHSRLPSSPRAQGCSPRPRSLHRLLSLLSLHFPRDDGWDHRRVLGSSDPDRSHCLLHLPRTQASGPVRARDLYATPISPMPSPGSFSDQPRPHMRDTMVNTAGASIVQGGRGHSSLSADAMLDPFVDPVPPAVKVTGADSDANPFADPQPSGAQAPAPASAAVQRLSVASTISVNVQPGVAM
ncbi:hypothetical protein C8Q74DRAFT_496101 [Fomes fomentarius]|nr:hypothetical protein C8Q74DRAFT_496101 [Fomes fomentarius]